MDTTTSHRVNREGINEYVCESNRPSHVTVIFQTRRLKCLDLLRHKLLLGYTSLQLSYPLVVVKGKIIPVLFN
jgi:hypothetical protein